MKVIPSFLKVALAVMVALGLAALGWGYLREVFATSTINERRFQQIEPGMSLKQVNMILGGPCRDESTGRLIVNQDIYDRDGALQLDVHDYNGALAFVRIYRRDLQNLEGSTQLWVSDHLIIRVFFDTADVVWKADCLRVRRDPEGAWESVQSIFWR
jgi:hypothetical protein